MNKHQKLSNLNQQSSWSDLPPEIIHQVLSFLPSTREAVKTCLISKSWLDAWLSWSCPLLIFINREDRAESYLKPGPFHKFVDHTMSMFDTPSRRLNLQKFVFDVHKLSLLDNESLEKWINIAIDNHVQEMALSKIVNYSASEFLERVFNNGSLRSLNLNFWSSPKIGTNDSINLPNVITLTLSMRVFSGESLERFLKGCPLLETVTLVVSSDRDLEIKITGCDHLKAVDLTVLQDLESVHIDAPNLETLRCNTIRTGEVSSLVSIDKCASKLKHLDLEFVTLDTIWFEGFVSQLVYLETLKLKFEKSSSSTFVITNPAIKNMELDRGESTTGPLVIVDVLKLSRFRYLGSLSHCYEYSGVVVYPPCDFIAHLRLILNCYLLDWLGKLSQTINAFSNLRSLSLVYCQKEHNWWEDDYCISRANSPTRLLGNYYHCPETTVDIGILQLTIVDLVDSELEQFTKLKMLLSGLFLIFHPAILTIEASGINRNEISRKELELLSENAIMSCVKCWEYQVNVVKIKKGYEFIPEERKISFILKW